MGHFFFKGLRLLSDIVRTNRRPSVIRCEPVGKDQLSMSQGDHGRTFRGMLLTPDGTKKVGKMQRVSKECSPSDAYTLGTRAGYDLREKAGDSFLTAATYD